MNNRAKKRNFKFIIVYVCVHHSGTKRVQKKNATIKIPIKKNLAGKDFIYISCYLIYFKNPKIFYLGFFPKNYLYRQLADRYFKKTNKIHKRVES